MKITKDQLESIYSEMERRCRMDDIRIVTTFRGEEKFSDEFCSMLQGMYSALKMVVENWSEAVFMMSEIEKRYFSEA